MRLLMVSELLDLVPPLVYVLTISITSASAAYVQRQQTSEYNQVKSLLVAVHFLYIGLVSLEFIRYYYSTPDFMSVYTIGNTTFVLVDVILLTIVALAIYFRPEGTGVLRILVGLTNRGIRRLIFILFCVYVAAAEVVLLVYQPFSIIVLPNLIGNYVYTQTFSSAYLDILLTVLIVFILYPSTLLFLASRRTKDPTVRRALVLLPIAWIGIGLVILIFNGYLLTVAKVDASAIGYLIAASAFSVSASVFRRATLISGFFAIPSLPVPQQVPGIERPFSQRVGVEPQRIVGRRMLMEVDPVTTYEQVVKEFSLEFGSSGYAVFAFVTKGSPIQTVLSSLPGVRFFILTEKVSYPRPSLEQNELLVPRNDQSVLLNVLDKALAANPQLASVIIFDGLTDMILSIGLESTYKFIKQANELLAISKTTALFVLTDSAQGGKETNVVKSLFTELLSYGTGGLQVTKTS